MSDTRLPLHKALDLALDEERGLLIVALYELPSAELENLVEAAQLINSEGVEILDAAPRPSDQWTPKTFDRAYGDAMAWGDWQTCEQMIAEREGESWWPAEKERGRPEEDRQMTVLREGLVLIERPWQPHCHPQRCGFSSKLSWVTEEDAMRIVHRLGNTGSCYWCQHCEGYHVTRKQQ